MQITTLARKCIVIVSLTFAMFCCLIEAFPQYALPLAFACLPTGSFFSLIYIHLCRERVIDNAPNTILKKSDWPLNVITTAAVVFAFYSFGSALLSLWSRL